MDPKQNGQLDPKLQEAYDRVMGISFSNPSDPAIPQVAQPSTTPTPVDPMAAPVTLTSDTQIVNTPSPVDGSFVNTTQPTPVQTPTVTPTDPMATPNTVTPSQTASTTPLTPPVMPETPTVVTPAQPTESLAATIPLATATVIPHSSETVRTGSLTEAKTESKQKKKGISPIIIVLGLVAFLLVYALFWVKFFNFPIPFLTQ